MYYVPQPHKCIKCGYECKSNSGEEFKICPKCYLEFLRANIGELLMNVNWDGTGSQYDKYKGEQNG